ncbi:MAG: hypothetical protein WBB81_07445 [Pyrinomonadaceae bacterium]
MEAAIAYVGFFSPVVEEFLNRYLGISTLRFLDFQTAGWYGSEVATKAFFVTLLFALFISLPLATGYRLISRMPWLLLQMARSPVTTMPRFIKTNFANLTAFYTRVSVVWIACATLIVVLFRGDSSYAIRSFLIMLLILGVVNFIVPQLIYANVVVKAELHWLKIAYHSVEKNFDSNSDKSSDDSSSVLKIEPYYLAYDRWVYPVHETYLIILAQGISLVGLQKLADFSLF